MEDLSEEVGEEGALEVSFEGQTLEESKEDDSKEDGGNEPASASAPVSAKFLREQEKMRQKWAKRVHWTNSLSGCVDSSQRYLDGFRSIANDPYFLFLPDILFLPPKATKPLAVTFRSKHEEGFRTLFKIAAFNAKLCSQYLECLADVQLPRVVCSLQHMHFPIVFENCRSEYEQVTLTNTSGLPADFRWRFPQLSNDPDFLVQNEEQDGGEDQVNVFLRS